MTDPRRSIFIPGHLFHDGIGIWVDEQTGYPATPAHIIPLRNLSRLFPNAEIVPCVTDYVILPFGGRRVEMESVLVEVDGEQVSINVCRITAGGREYVYYHNKEQTS